MPTHLSVARTVDRVFQNQDGGLPGVPGSGGPSFDKPQGQPGPPAGQPLPGQAGHPGQHGQHQPVFQQQPGGYQQQPGGPGPYGGPPQGGGTFELSGWWRRVGATVIDGFVVGIPLTIIFFIVGIGVGMGDTDASAGETAFDIGAILLSMLLGLVAYILYAPTVMAKTNGQTLGKMATGIRVVRVDGQAITFGFGMFREIAIKYLLVGIIGAIPLYLGIILNYLWPLWDAEHRAGHDAIAKTRVVRA